MKTVGTACPAPELLRAFALGKLRGPVREDVEAHVAGCESCCGVLSSVSDDALVDLVRDVADTTSRAVLREQTRGPSQTAARPESAGPLGPANIPRDLVDHPRYRVIGLLGRGGMGTVYRAEHRIMQRPVALKVINQRLMTDRRALERFGREVKAAASLIHPNIATAHDADTAGELHFLVMELVEGESLAEKVQAQGPLPVAAACDYLRQAACGLQHAFEKGMIHRDIKPHNLMLTPAGQVKILDFGLARFVQEASRGGELAPGSHEDFDDQEVADGCPQEFQLPETDLPLTRTDMVLGTADFVAPEQASDSRTADIRADIYSLGCSLYYLIAGHPPFPEKSLLGKLSGHFARQPASLLSLRHDVPPGVDQVVACMLAKSPADRYATPADVAGALARFSNPSVPQAAAAPRIRRAPARVPHSSDRQSQKLLSSEVRTTPPLGSQQSTEQTDWSHLATQETALSVSQPAAGSAHTADTIASAPVGTQPQDIQFGETRSRLGALSESEAVLGSRPTAGPLVWAVGGVGVLCALAAIGLVQGFWDSGKGQEEVALSRRKSSGESVTQGGMPGVTVSEELRALTGGFAKAAVPPRVLMVVPKQNAWYPDVAPVIRRFQDYGASVDLASWEKGGISWQPPPAGMPPQTTQPMEIGLTLNEVVPEQYSAVVFAGFQVAPFLPSHRGGYPDQVKAILEAMVHTPVSQGEQPRCVGAICAGIAVPAAHGLLAGREAAFSQYASNQLKDAGFSGEAQWREDLRVCVDGSLITASADKDAEEFVDAICGSIWPRRILIVVPQQGVWLPALDAVRDGLVREGHQVGLASPEGGTASLSSGQRLPTDLALKEVDPRRYAGVIFIGQDVSGFLPGGSAAEPSRYVTAALSSRRDGVVGAVGEGIAVLAAYNTVEGRALADCSSARPFLKKQTTSVSWVSGGEVVRSGPLVTVSSEQQASQFLRDFLGQIRNPQRKSP